MTISVYSQEQVLNRPLPLHITSIGRWNNFVTIASFQAAANFGNATWPASNRAVYVPMTIPARFTVARFMVCNGSTVAGNLDVGLYNANGSRLISTGTTAQAGTTQVQYIDVTNQSFPAGNYYLALVLSDTGGRVSTSAISVSTFEPFIGSTLENLGSTVLPATMTPAVRTVNGLPCFGFTQSDTL